MTGQRESSVGRQRKGNRETDGKMWGERERDSRGKRERKVRRIAKHAVDPSPPFPIIVVLINTYCLDSKAETLL